MPFLAAAIPAPVTRAAEQLAGSGALGAAVVLLLAVLVLVLVGGYFLLTKFLGALKEITAETGKLAKAIDVISLRQATDTIDVVRRLERVEGKVQDVIDDLDARPSLETNP